MTLERGWKARQRAAVERRADEDAERAFVREERRRHRELLELQARTQIAEAEAQRLQTFVSCPCCGQGAVTIPTAELITRAVSSLNHDSKPDADHLEILTDIGAGRPVHSRYGLPLKHGLHHPRATADKGLAPKPAEISPRPEPVTTPKRATKPARIDPPWLDSDAVCEDD